jgi:hypothetical protein
MEDSRTPDERRTRTTYQSGASPSIVRPLRCVHVGRNQMDKRLAVLVLIVLVVAAPDTAAAA